MTRIAIVPVRAGQLPSGAHDAAEEANGNVLFVETAGHFATVVDELVALVAESDIVVLPASPDGRDLAPLIAHRLGWPLLANAIAIHDGGATCARWGGRVVERVAVGGAFVATMQPNVVGAAGASLAPTDSSAGVRTVSMTTPAGAERPRGNIEVIDVLPPDVSTMDLAEATRVVGGGAGLDSPERFTQLRAVAAQLGAAMGGTRVITDRGWIDHDRQIGTTGVSVSPDLYLAFGISGAVQHTAGLGDPAHIIAVNIDQHCPMMQLADLAIVADANATLDELARLLAAPSDDRRAGAAHG